MGTFPTDTFTAADLAEYIPEKWSMTINDFFRAKLAAARFFLDMSDDVEDGGDIIHIPNVTEPAATSKTIAQAVTIVSATETPVDLTVTTWKECSFAIEDNQASQVLRSYNTQKIYIQASGFACAKSLDTALMALYSGLDNSVNDSASAVADADILEAIQTLDEADVPAEDRQFFFRPSIVWGDLMALDKYTHASEMGQQNMMNQGAIGMLYGIPVVSTTQVTKTHTDYVHNLLAHKSAFAWATRSLPGAYVDPDSGASLLRLQANYVPQYLSTLSTADIIYGVVENIDNAAVEIRSIA